MSIFAQLCRWRLAHFGATSFRLLERRWQNVLFLLFILSPALMPLSEQIYWLGRPVAVIAVSGGALLALGALGLVALCGWLWTGLQMHALDGANAWRHLCTMPLGTGMALRVDLVVLILADLPLWLPFAAAMFSLRSNPAAMTTVAALAIQLPLAQALIFRGRLRAANCLLFDAAGIVLHASGASAWLLTSMAACGAGTALVCLIRAPSHSVARARMVPHTLRLKASRNSVLNLAAINLRHLFSFSQLTQHVRLLLCATWPLLLDQLLSLSQLDAPSSRTVLLLLAWPPQIFNLAGLAVNLTVLHSPMQPIYRSLGVLQNQFHAASLLVLGTLLSLICLPLADVLYVHGQSMFILLMFPIGAVALVMCAQLNINASTQVFLPKLVVVMLACIAQLSLLSI